jgi:hypothetical protein
MFGIHWIPTHRGSLGGTPDRDIFARWAPGIVKIITIDNTVPYTGDVPAGALILVRNHPMSELNGDRSLVPAAGAGAPPVADEPPEALEARYTAYFEAWLDRPPGAPERDTAERSLATSGPENIAVEHARICQEMALYCESKGVPRSRLLFEGLNEPQLWASEPPDLTARYYRAFLVGLHNYGLRGVVGNFGVGWPGNGGVSDTAPDWEFFRPVIDEFWPGDYLGLHEYWALDGPQQNWLWWAGRFLQCPYQVPILITETGIDTGVTGQWYGGWRDLPGNSENEKAVRYSNELVWYAQQCYNDGRIKQVFTFTYDIGSSHWEKFDIRSWAFLDEFFKVKDQVPNQPLSPPPTASFHDWLLAEGEVEQVIQFNPDAALQKAIFADGLVPNSPEFRRVGEGTPIIAQRADRLSDGVVRVYYARESELDTVVYEQR